MATELVRTAAPVAEGSFKSKVVFDEIRAKLEKEGNAFVKKMNGIYCFKIRRDKREGIWFVDLKNGGGCVKYNFSGTSDVTITVDDDYFLQLRSGKLSPPEAFLKGYLKVQGNLGLAFKLRELLLQLQPSKL